jgi:hypothetical protein
MTVAEAHAEVAEHCAQIAKLFKPGAKITILVRNPDWCTKEPHSGDMTVGDDDLAEAIAALTYLKDRKEVSL